MGHTGDDSLFFGNWDEWPQYPGAKKADRGSQLDSLTNWLSGDQRRCLLEPTEDASDRGSVPAAPTTWPRALEVEPYGDRSERVAMVWDS